MFENLRFANFVHFFERDGIVAIFHALSRDVVFVDKASLAGIHNVVKYPFC